MRAEPRIDVKPALLAEAAGVHYQEFSNLNDPLPVTSAGDDLVLSPSGRATRWADSLVSEGATVLASYEHPHFGQFPAAVSTEHGQGRITTIGTVHDLVSSATAQDGSRLHVVHKWSWEPQTVPTQGLFGMSSTPPWIRPPASSWARGTFGLSPRCNHGSRAWISAIFSAVATACRQVARPSFLGTDSLRAGG